MPGPLFTFSAYLGTVIGHDWFAGVWCLVWIFLPSFLLLLGVLPFWSRFGELIGYSLRSVSGYLADKSSKYWIVTFVGYLINMLAVPALAGNWPLAKPDAPKQDHSL